MIILSVILLLAFGGLWFNHNRKKEAERRRKEEVECIMFREACAEMKPAEIEELCANLGFEKTMEVIINRYKINHGIEL